MNSDLLEKSFELMVIGMGMTFVFLLLLVGAMNALAFFVKITEKFQPQAAPSKSSVTVGEKLKIALAIAGAKHFSK